MRIGIDAHTVGRGQTGNERFSVELASALCRRDDIDVLAYVDHQLAWPAERLPRPTLVGLRTRRPQLRIPVELPVRAWRDRLDLLQVAYVGPPLNRVPLVTVVHDVSFEDRPELYTRRTRLRLKASVRGTVGRSAAVVTGSAFTRQRLIELYGLLPERVHHVRYGVGDFWRAVDGGAADSLLAPLRLPERFVLAVGTDQPRKNLARLVRAVEELRRTGETDLGLVLAGPTGRSTDEPDWIRRLGYVDDETLRALYGRAVVFAYPSLYEGFGLPVLEALASGAIVIASGTTAVAEAAGDACVPIDPEDPASIVAGLRSAVADEALRAALRARAPAHVAAFSWDTCAGQMVNVYRTALDLYG